MDETAVYLEDPRRITVNEKKACISSQHRLCIHAYNCSFICHGSGEKVTTSVDSKKVWSVRDKF
jgi:hypothetical protein